ncbi:MAG TPA: alanine racemase [Mycobacterium sp.]|nr:alanine racemase [Mycobacterium sp.]
MSVAELDRNAVAALADEPLDWRFKGLPPSWAGRTPAQICADRPALFGDGPTGPVCVLRADALTHNLRTMADWCRDAGVEIAPHGKTHMAPQLFSRQLDAGARGITAATISQIRVCRAFGVSDVILANELVDPGGLRWLAGELDRSPEFGFVCWVDSVRGVQTMAAELSNAGATRPVDVCVEVGIADGRTGCRSPAEVDDVARAVLACPYLRLVGVAGYEAALGHDVSAEALSRVADFLRDMRSAVQRLTFEADEVLVTAGGSTYFDLVAEILTGDWRTVIRSGAYLTHDHGLYRRTSPLTRAGNDGLRPAMSVWAQVTSMPEPGLALLTMGRRDVSFDQDLPLALELPDSHVSRLNDQHAYLRLGPGDRSRVDVGTWLEFGISHPCTVFDKWQLIPVLDADGRVVDLIRTFF